MNRNRHPSCAHAAPRRHRAAWTFPLLALCALLPCSAAFGQGEISNDTDPFNLKDGAGKDKSGETPGGGELVQPFALRELAALSGEVSDVGDQVSALSDEVARVSGQVAELPDQINRASSYLANDIISLSDQLGQLVKELEDRSVSTGDEAPPPSPAPEPENWIGALVGDLKQLPGSIAGISGKLDESESAMARMEKMLAGRLRLLVVLAVCVVVMLVALGAVVFLGSRNPEPTPARPAKPSGGDAPPDWRTQLEAAHAAEQQAKRDAQTARESEKIALERAAASREAEKSAIDGLRRSGDAAAEAEKAAQAVVRAAISAFASCRGLDENDWLTALRDVARGLSEVAAERGASPKDGLALLAKWSRVLSEFSTPERKFDLNLPAIGADIDTSWMTPARAGASKVSRVVTWAVYTKSGVRHNAEVE